jgi:hypothetical protein
VKKMAENTRMDGYRIPVQLGSTYDSKIRFKLLFKWISVYSILLLVVFFLCIFFWDYYAGQVTSGFGVEGDRYMGIGMFYIYMTSLFLSLIVLSVIYKTNQTFGVGFLVFVPYAVIGFFVEYYYEIDVLKGVWAVIGWCLIGLLVGLSADITFKLVKNQTKIRHEYIAGITGVSLNLTYFLLVWIAIEIFYVSGTGLSGPGSFLGVAYFGLPWMLIHGFIGGYLAYKMNEKIR